MDTRVNIDTNNYQLFVNHWLTNEYYWYAGWQYDYHISIYEYGFTIACQHGYLNIVEYLLSNIHFKNEFKIDIEKGFIRACTYGQLAVVKYLLENNYNINVHAHNEWGFRWACNNGHLNVVKYLLENDYNINVHAFDEDGFIRACHNGQFIVIHYLLENNYDINVHANNEYGFMCLCEKNKLNIVKYILTKTNITNEIVKILCKYKCEYFDCIKPHKYYVKVYNNHFHLYKVLFTIYNTINIENCIYFGII